MGILASHVCRRGGGSVLANNSKTTPRGRDARTGEFTTVEKARQQPNTHTVERVPKPGHGDTKKK